MGCKRNGASSFGAGPWRRQTLRKEVKQQKTKLTYSITNGINPAASRLGTPIVCIIQVDWTYKIKGKTVNVKLSPQAAPLYKAATKQHRQLKIVLARLERLSKTALAHLAKQADNIDYPYLPRVVLNLYQLPTGLTTCFDGPRGVTDWNSAVGMFFLEASP
jgi:hypothetical protein